MQDIMAALEEHIRQKYEIEEDDEDFSVDVHLFDYGYVDSAGATELIAHIENKYGIQITNQDLMMYPLNTIREISQFIAQKIARS